MQEAVNAAEKVHDLFGAENNGKFLRFLGSRDDVVQFPIPMQGNSVKETKGRGGDQDGTGGELLFVGQIDLIGTNLLGAEEFRRLVEVTRKQGDLLHVSVDCKRREV